MQQYYVNINSQPNGDHEVHSASVHCPHPPLQQNRMALGWFANCREAVSAAKRTYRQSNGCAYCVPLCNTG